MRSHLQPHNGVPERCVVAQCTHPGKMVAHWMAGLLCVLLLMQVANGQTTLLYTINYVADRTTMYVYPDSLNSFFIHEQIALLPVHQRDSVIRMVYTNKDVKNITYHQIDSRFEDWMTRPAKSVVDKKSVKLYNSSGALILSQLHTAEYKSLYADLKTQMTTLSADLIPDYVQLTNALKSTLIANGFVMTNLGGGTYKFVKDSVEIRYNNSRKMNEMRLYHSDGSLKYALLRDFAVNSFGQTTPVLTQERRPDTRFPGSCVEEVVTTQYPMYYMTYGGVGREDDIVESEAMTLNIAPNPVTATAIITYPITVDVNMHAQIAVFDLTGRMVMHSDVDASVGSYELQTTTLPQGMYTVRYTCGAVELEIQFVK